MYIKNKTQKRNNRDSEIKKALSLLLGNVVK